jgi:hypothetical protein
MVCRYSIPLGDTMRRLSLVAPLLLVAVPGLSAQRNGPAEATPLRVRLVPVHASWKPMTGTLVSIGADTIRFVRDGNEDTVRVLAADLERIERSTGQRSKLGRGMLLGALIGGAAGGGAGFALRNLEPEEAAPYLVPAGIGAGAVLGVIVGGIWGASSHDERWEAMPTISADRLQPGAAAPGGVRVGLVARVSF